MSRPDWTTIKGDYIETTMTLAEVQAKHCVPRGTLSARATREKWHDAKQQFAAILEQQRREKKLQMRAAMQDQFEDNVLKVAKVQLLIIARQMQGDEVDAVKLLKLTNALEKVQRIAGTAFGNS